MSRTTLRRTIVLLVLAITFATPWTVQADPGSWTPPQARAAAPAWSGALGQIWPLLVRLWDEIGCNIDPHGGCTAATAVEPPGDLLEEGSNIDPSGGRAAADHLDEGCNIDPDGCQR
jgi:hypothetical protein